METPLCEICLKSDILCAGCEAKLKEGKISQLDVKLSKALYTLSKKFKALKNVTFIRAIEMENQIIVIVKKGDAGKVIGKNGVVVKELTRRFNRRLRVVEYKEPLREFLQDVLFPVPLLGINIIYTPEGKKYKVRISKKDASKFSIDANEIKNLVENLTSLPTEVALE